MLYVLRDKKTGKIVSDLDYDGKRYGIWFDPASPYIFQTKAKAENAASWFSLHYNLIPEPHKLSEADYQLLLEIHRNHPVIWASLSASLRETYFAELYSPERKG